jgi:hypothetical protein
VGSVRVRRGSGLGGAGLPLLSAPSRGGYAASAFYYENSFCVGLLYGRAGCLTVSGPASAAVADVRAWPQRPRQPVRVVLSGGTEVPFLPQPRRPRTSPRRCCTHPIADDGGYTGCWRRDSVAAFHEHASNPSIAATSEPSATRPRTLRAHAAVTRPRISSVEGVCFLTLFEIR